MSVPRTTFGPSLNADSQVPTPQIQNAYSGVGLWNLHLKENPSYTRTLRASDLERTIFVLAQPLPAMQLRVTHLSSLGFCFLILR